MIELQISELVKTKGFKAPYRRFAQAGISNKAVQGYLTGKRTKLNLEHIEIICTLLRCTPDKLLAWTPSEPADDYPEHPLQPLRKKPLLNVDEALSKLSPDEIERRLGGI